MLYHLSEQSGIARFDPRPSRHTGEPVVWAVDEARLRNYLVPRDCPRVTFYAGPQTTPEDVARFLGSSPAVVAVEGAWLDRMRACRLFCYHLPGETFACIDECAGYHVSRASVVPERVEVFDDLLAALIGRGAEVRFLPDLWALRDAVVGSTLRFSIIRMQNARARPVEGRSG